MQIKCGQCGTLHDLEQIEGMESVRCMHCGHAIRYLDMSAEPSEPGTVCEGRFDDNTEGFAQQARQALRERMLVVCAHCNARIRVSKRMAGQTIHCTSCSKELCVPENTAEDQVDISYLISPSDVVMGRDPRAKKSSRRRRRLATKKRIQFALKIAAGCTVVILAASLIWQGTNSDVSRKDYLSEERYDEQDAPDLIDVADETVPEASAPTAPPVVAVAPPTPGGLQVSLAGKPTFRAFASGGYYPARPGRWYCTLRVRVVSAGDQPRHFYPAKSARLISDGASHPCLGEVIENSLLPVQARTRSVILLPAASTTVRLLFEIPETVRTGTLQIDGLGELDVTLPAPARGKIAPAGRFAEAPPRNLKVLLDDPVMAAIQSAARQELRIRQNGTLLDVRIDQAEVIGQGRPAGNETYAVVLRHGPHSIEGVLRFLPDGKRIILYLSDQPMHQMTYQRKQTGDTDDDPSSPDDDRPQFFGV